MSHENDGLYAKYTVHRTDERDKPGSKHERCEYFVLDLTHDKHAIPAIEAYLASCRSAGEFELLANDLSLIADAARARMRPARGDVMRDDLRMRHPAE